MEGFPCNLCRVEPIETAVYNEEELIHIEKSRPDLFDEECYAFLGTLPFAQVLREEFKTLLVPLVDVIPGCLSHAEYHIVTIDSAA